MGMPVDEGPTVLGVAAKRLPANMSRLAARRQSIENKQLTAGSPRPVPILAQLREPVPVMAQSRHSWLKGEKPP